MPTEPTTIDLNEVSEMIELADVIERLLAGERRLQETCQQLVSKNVQQDAQIAAQQRLLDSHELRIELLERALPKGRYDA